MKSLLFLLLFSVSISGGSFHFTGNIPPEIKADHLEKQFHQILHKLDSTNTGPHHNPVFIIFYHKSEQKQLGIHLPEWGGGGAIGTDTVVIPLDRASAFYERDLNKIILHELVHIAITRLFGKTRVPRWFHEGTAMALSGEISLDEQILLSRALLTRRVLPLDSIDFVNRFDQWKARLGYSQSHAIVLFLIDNYGIDLIPELIKASRKTRRFEDACVQTFGLTTREIEDLFTKEMHKLYPLLMLASDFSLFWLLVLFLSVIAWIVIRTRKNIRRKEMELEESAKIDLQDDLETDASNDSIAEK
jgi:cbb3-type cytochrome oxidase subunit 3